MDKYCLPDDYLARLENSYFDDTPYRDEYQDEVYSTAKKMFTDMEMRSVLDIGTGSGYKLMKYFKEFNTMGADLEPTLTFLRNKYPDRQWGTLDDLPSWWDMIICSDVLEHISDPDAFLDLILQKNFAVAVFSTPDRDSLYHGPGNLGMPSNPAHVREWTMPEFLCYMKKKFYVLKQIKIEPNTQIIICQKK